MTDKEFQAVLEAIKEYAQETQSIEKTIALIERMQGKEKELTSGTTYAQDREGNGKHRRRSSFPFILSWR